MAEGPVALDRLTADDFAPVQDSTFTLHLADGEVPLRLTEVRGLSEPNLGTGRRAAFSLLFSGPPNVPLPQQIYTLTHPAMGTLEIFLVPIAADAAQRRYEAVFN